MKKIIIKKQEETAYLDNIPNTTPIFAVLEGEVRGMVVLVNSMQWCLCLGGSKTSSGYHGSRKDCIEHNMEIFEYEFVIDIKL